MFTHSPSRDELCAQANNGKLPPLLLLTLILLAVFISAPARAEYYNFNVAYGSECIMQEARWPSFCDHFYDTLYQGNPVLGSQGETASFYGGMPHDCNWTVPCRIIWSFFSVKNSAPGAMVTPHWLATNMYAPPHVGEGADSKAAGDWPILQTNRWYREVIRVWPAVDGSTNTGYVARWLRDSANSNWHHIATMKVPYTPTGLEGLGGFKESLAGESGSSRTDYRNVYYRLPSGASWERANVFNPSTRTLGQRGAAALIENCTAAFFEMGTDLVNMASNPPPVSGTLYLMVSTNESEAGLLTNPLPAGMQALASPAGVVLTITNQPLTPTLDPIVVSSAAAYTHGTQLLVNWQIPPTSSPQFAYRIEVFNNSNYTGTAAVSFFNIDPEARQKLLNISGVATPYARLTIMDVVYQTNTPIALTLVPVSLQAATNVAGTVSGLAYKYFESATNFTALPNFAALTPVSQGAVNFPDLTPRQQRDHYAFNYTGFISVPADGIYTFTLNSSDGSKLIIDGNTVVNWDGLHSPGTKSGWVGLQAGKHAVNVQYFFGEQNPDAHDLHDVLSLSYAGPGVVESEVPLNAWFRVPGVGEPVVMLTTPVNNTTLCGSNVTLEASVTANGATVNSVQYYIGNTWLSTDTLAPYSHSTLLWAAPSNALRARLLCNGSNTFDSTPNLVTTTNMDLTPWTLSPIGQRTYPTGARKSGATWTLLGDGLNFLHQQISGDCTIVARRAGIISRGVSAPDGQTPSTGWDAGIILRQNTNNTPGAPLGSDEAEYASVYSSVGGGTYFQDHTMKNAGGPYASANLGSYSWFKLQRVGDTFTSFVSNDGSTWVPVNTNTLTGIGTVLYAGVFTYAGWSQNPNVFWASFDNVSLTGNLLGPPSVSVFPESQTVISAQSASFTASPNGNPPFAYQWQCNNVSLPGATNATLTLTNLQPGDSGLYRVLLTTSNGTASAMGTLTVLTPVSSTAYAGQVLSNSPFAYWRLGETSGTTAQDIAGARNGTYNSVTLATSGPQPVGFPGFETTNYAAQFDGTSSFVNAGSLGLAGPLTLTAWIKPTDVSRQQGILTESGSYFFKLVNGNLLLKVGGTDYTAGASLTSGVWQHVAVTLTPSTLGGIKFYKNGQFVGSADAPTLTAGNSAFWIGKNQFAAQFFGGAIDEVAVFNRALTTTEIESQYQAAVTAPANFVTLTSPASGTIFTAPATIPLTASVVTNGHIISKVQFFNGTNLLSESLTPPHAYTWTNVPAGTYSLWAQAVYDGTNTMSSTPAFVTAIMPPATPTGLTATPGNAQVALSWNAAAYATSYHVKRADVPGGPYTHVANVTSNASLDTTTLNGSTYYYVVSALNAIGESANSAETIAALANIPLADAFVRDGGYANDNYGTDPTLFVKLSGTGFIREGYLKFDVTGLADAERVQLRLMPVSVTGSPILGFEFVANDTWTEAGLTWNNKPSGSGTIFTNLAGYAAGTPILVDVTTQAKSEATQDGLLSIRIYSTTSGSPSVTFGSKEQSATTNQPQLIAEWQANTAPTISAQPQSVTPYVGSNANFSVTANGSPAPVYQWRLNGTNIGGATASNYTVLGAQPANEGTYTVVVSNLAGTVTSSGATLNLHREFGRAPAPYPSLLSSNGARHLVVPGLQLGATNVISTDARTNSLGDDGVQFLTTLQPGQSASVRVVASAAGRLNGWIDFGGNGSWSEGADHAFTDVALSPGTNTLNFIVPTSAVAGSNLWARMRFSSATNFSFTGEVADGEVEDHPVTINNFTLIYAAGANGTINGTSPQTVNYGGSGSAVTAVPNAGYAFTNWTDGLTSNPRTDANVTSNLTVTANFISVSTGALPAPWGTNRVGAITAATAATYTNGAFTVTGAGANISGKNDNFWYVNQPFTNNATLVARVVNLPNTGSAARAGVMMRESTNSDARMVFMGLTPTSGAQWVRRTSTGGNSSSTTVSGKAAPYWVKLDRTGNSFQGYISTNGANWSLVASVNMNLNANYILGLAVCSSASGTLNASLFDNVTVNSVGGPSNAAPATSNAPAQAILGPAAHTGQALYFDATGAAGSIWQLEESSNLKDWTPLQKVGLVDGVVEQSEADGSQSPRFLRLRWTP